MNDYLKTHWEAVFGKSREATAALAWLESEYSHPRRKYHNLQHVEAMLRRLEEFEPAMLGSVTLNLAIWFHDSVFYPGWIWNERRSAKKAGEWGRLLGLDQKVIEKAKAMILLTASRPDQIDDYETGLFLDLDYFILAEAPKAYAEYAFAIRQEVGWLYRVLFFRSARQKFLRNVVKRKHIFFTEKVRQFEERAKENMGCELLAGAGIEKWRGGYYAPVELHEGYLLRYIIGADHQVQIERILLSEVLSIHVLKRDLLTTDEILMELRVGNTSVGISEEAIGAREVFSKIDKELPGATSFSEWFLMVAFPAFEANVTQVYSRDR